MSWEEYITLISIPSSLPVAPIVIAHTAKITVIILLFDGKNCILTFNGGAIT